LRTKLGVRPGPKTFYKRTRMEPRGEWNVNFHGTLGIHTAPTPFHGARLSKRQRRAQQKQRGEREFSKPDCKAVGKKGGGGFFIPSVKAKNRKMTNAVR